MTMSDPLLTHIQKLHALGPQYLASFLADLSELAKCEETILDLLRAYSEISTGYVRARKK